MMYSVSGPGSPFGFFFLATVAIILIASWVILAGSRFVQGGVVERPERVPQLYGYTVCLIAVVVGLASVLALVESGLALAIAVALFAWHWRWLRRRVEPTVERSVS